jgi:uncharacterized membrane protein
MAQTNLHPHSSDADPQSLPFAAPHRKLTYADPITWLREGWRDYLAAPSLSIGYGAALALLSWFVLVTGFKLGGYVLILALLSGFVFIAPVLAIGFYAIARQLEQGRAPRLTDYLRSGRQLLGSEMILSLVLLLILLLWARAASTVNVFFPDAANPSWTDLALYLGVGSAVGAVFAAAVFTASAFSLPMILDRKVDAITAVATSANAVLHNKGPAAVWAAMIVAGVAIGFMTVFIGFIIVMPVLGYATWHGYRHTILSDAWPINDSTGAAASRSR